MLLKWKIIFTKLESSSETFFFPKEVKRFEEQLIILHKRSVLVAQSCLTLCDTMDPPGSSVHGILNTGVGCHFLLQEILPTQGSNPRLLHCRWFFTAWATREAPLHKGCPHQFSPSPLTARTLSFHSLTVFPTSIKVSFSSDLPFFPFYYLLIMISHIKCFSQFLPHRNPKYSSRSWLIFFPIPLNITEEHQHNSFKVV